MVSTYVLSPRLSPRIHGAREKGFATVLDKNGSPSAAYLKRSDRESGDCVTGNVSVHSLEVDSISHEFLERTDVENGSANASLWHGLADKLPEFVR